MPKGLVDQLGERIANGTSRSLDTQGKLAQLFCLDAMCTCHKALEQKIFVSSQKGLTMWPPHSVLLQGALSEKRKPSEICKRLGRCGSMKPEAE
jgi:hypothetical protein